MPYLFCHFAVKILFNLADIWHSQTFATFFEHAMRGYIMHMQTHSLPAALATRVVTAVVRCSGRQDSVLTFPRESPFFWKQIPGSGACCDGAACMSEIRYSNWASWEPNNRGSYNGNLQVAPSPMSEKWLQLCRGWSYRWNDALCEIPTCLVCEIDLAYKLRTNITSATVDARLS